MLGDLWYPAALALRRFGVSGSWQLALGDLRRSLCVSAPALRRSGTWPGPELGRFGALVFGKFLRFTAPVVGRSCAPTLGPAALSCVLPLWPSKLCASRPRPVRRLAASLLGQSGAQSLRCSGARRSSVLGRSVALALEHYGATLLIFFFFFFFFIHAYSYPPPHGHLYICSITHLFITHVHRLID